MPGESVSRHARINRSYWDAYADEYQAEHGSQLDPEDAGWGVWQLPERQLRILGDVRDRDVLELGCGAAQWSIWLAGQGARPVGLDNSARQLEHARRLMDEAGVDFPLIHASAEAVPWPGESFDRVFCDHGAMSFCDPHRTIPEAARLLRPGGLLAFNMSSPIHFMSWSAEEEQTVPALQNDYFGMFRWQGDGHVEFNLPYGEWIRLLRSNGFVVQDLIELRPPEGATTTYPDYVPLEWARRWPAENIWVARRSEGQSRRGSASASRS